MSIGYVIRDVLSGEYLCLRREKWSFKSDALLAHRFVGSECARVHLEDCPECKFRMLEIVKVYDM